MVKKQNQHKLRQKNTIALGILTLLFVSIAALAVELKTVKDQLATISNFKISYYIVQAVDDLLEPLPIHEETGQRYIPEARLRLPTTINRDLSFEYTYLTGSEETGAEIQLANTQSVATYRNHVMNGETVESIFSSVPLLQACSRGYIIRFSPAETPELTLRTQKTLRDGRILYLYSDNNCLQEHTEPVDYLSQIESY